MLKQSKKLVELRKEFEKRMKEEGVLGCLMLWEEDYSEFKILFESKKVVSKRGPNGSIHFYSKDIPNEKEKKKRLENTVNFFHHMETMIFNVGGFILECNNLLKSKFKITIDKGGGLTSREELEN